jgi:putative DNA methylase
MAIVVEKHGRREYLSPSPADSEIAAAAEFNGVVSDSRATFLSPTTPTRAMITGGVCSAYGLRTYGHLFTARQIVALTLFSDLVSKAREAVLNAAVDANFSDEDARLSAGGVGATAYADAVATYLGLAVDRLTDRASSICTWDTGAEGKSSTGSPGRSAAIRGTFSRQAIPMTWDFAEGNVFSDSAANFNDAVGWLLKPFDFGRIPATGIAAIDNLDAAKNNYPVRPVVISTDPPYYDNIGYADLSDYFYIWLRRSLAGIWPDLFRRLTAPKAEELVATPYRFADGPTPSWAEQKSDLAARWQGMNAKVRAEAFFMNGMSEALRAMQNAATDGEPLAIYYAFKQSEVAKEGLTSAGWASFLQAVVDAGLSVDRTWPIRTELSSRMIGQGANALASSIILVCRKRGETAGVVTRADFIRALKREMPSEINAIRKAGVGPVDMQQSVIGPGMGIFSRHTRVLEDDDSAMDVKTALALINRVWEEIENELDSAFDAETQVALAWFATYGFDARTSGELITLTTAKNTTDRALFASGVFKDMKGKTGLTPREDLPRGWSPASDKTLTTWECVQHTARVLNAPDGGGEAAAALVAQMGPKAEEARALAYRLFEIATNKGWAAEALVYNELAQEWTRLEDRAATLNDAGRVPGPNQAAFTFEGTA